MKRDLDIVILTLSLSLILPVKFALVTTGCKKHDYLLLLLFSLKSIKALNFTKNYYVYIFFILVQPLVQGQQIKDPKRDPEGIIQAMIS